MHGKSNYETHRKTFPMKSLLVNSFDLHGGAAIATYRLHHALRTVNVESNLFVQRKYSSDETVIASKSAASTLVSQLSSKFDSLPLKRYPARTGQLFSPAITPDRLIRRVKELDPDIVHLFWITAGFIKIESLAKLNKRVVWTLHDMWPFTGGCHYDNYCNRYTKSCGKCPLLGSSKDYDLSAKVLQRKQAAWNDLDITIVATSRWLADCAQKSTLFQNKRIEIIANAFDIEKYHPIDKPAARNAFNFPQHKKLVLFSAFNATNDKRKGYQHLLPALKNMNEHDKADIELIILGANKPAKTFDFGMEVHYIEHLQDEISQVLLYSAVDVLVLPSEQENLSNTVIEAMLCATPVVAFEIGGMPDIIEHNVNGYLAKPFEPVDLAEGILRVLNALDSSGMALSARCIAVEKYNREKIANEYLNLYQDIKNDKNNTY